MSWYILWEQGRPQETNSYPCLISLSIKHLPPKYYATYLSATIPYQYNFISRGKYVFILTINNRNSIGSPSVVKNICLWIFSSSSSIHLCPLLLVNLHLLVLNTCLWIFSSSSCSSSSSSSIETKVFLLCWVPISFYEKARRNQKLEWSVPFNQSLLWFVHALN